MNLDALLRVFYLDVYEFEVYDPFSRPQTRILRGIAVLLIFFTALALKLTTVAVCIINGGHTFLLQRPSWLCYTNFLKFRFCKVNSCVMHLRDDWRDISLKFFAQNYQEFFGWQTFRRKQTSRTEGQSLKKSCKKLFSKMSTFF